MGCVLFMCDVLGYCYEKSHSIYLLTFSGWNDVDFVNHSNRNRHSSGSMPTSTTSTIIFTSDALKKLRKNQLLPDSQSLTQNPPPPDLNSLASKLTRPAPNFLASAATYSRRRQNNSFQKGENFFSNIFLRFLEKNLIATNYLKYILISILTCTAGSLAAKSCFNLLDPDGRATSKPERENVICSASNASAFQRNESLVFEATPGNQSCFKKNSLFMHGEKSNRDQTWSKNRILKPAKSTPSLLQIDDEQVTTESVGIPSPSEGLIKLRDVEYIPTHFNGKK